MKVNTFITLICFLTPFRAYTCEDFTTELELSRIAAPFNENSTHFTELIKIYEDLIQKMVQNKTLSSESIRQSLDKKLL